MEKIEIDLTRLIRMFNKLSSNVNYELEIIKNYSYIVNADNNTVKAVTSKMLSDSYGNSDYSELELSTFYKIERVYDTIERFLEIMEFILLNKVNPYFENITFKEIKSISDNKLVVVFNVIY